jgi:hypothetical protein
MPKSLYDTKAAPTYGVGAGESNFMKVLHGFQTPLYITAGVVEESIRRAEGKPKVPYSSILRESGANLIPWLSDTRRQVTYGNIVDNKALAFGFDIFGDPITYIPAAALSKFWKGAGWVAKGAVRTPTKAALHGADRVLGTEFVASAEKFSDAVQRAVIPNADLKRLAGKELEAKKIQSYRDIEKSARDLEEKVISGLGIQEWDYKTKALVFDLVEKRPRIPKGGKLTPEEISAMMNDPGYQEFVSGVRSLSPDQYRVFNRIIKARDFLEEMKLESGLITEGQIAGFERRFGIGYLPHKRGTYEDVVARAEVILQGLEAGDEEVIAGFKKYKGASGNIGDIEEVKREMRTMLEKIKTQHRISGPEVMEAIRKHVSSTKPRYHGGTRDQLEATGMALEVDASKVLGAEARQVGSAMAALHHAQKLGDWLVEKGWMWDEIPDMDSLVAAVGKKNADNITRGGFERIFIPGNKEVSGKLIPKAVAAEIKSVFKMYRSPKEMQTFLHTYRKVQNIWKAWTLSIFPSYGLRNTYSNLWNNFLAGMGPTAVPHYDKAMHLMWKWKAGGLSKAEKQIIDEAVDMRVVRSGLTAGEVGEVMNQQLQRLTTAGKVGATIFHPAHNPLVKAGFAANTFSEDYARLAHYLWAKNSKKLSKEEAASSVNKYLFDYKYGLTPLEKKLFRDFQAPFYQWTRFNLPLQLEMLATKPGRFLTMPKGMRALEDIGNMLSSDGWGAPEPNEMFMSDWMKKATKLRFRWNSEKEVYEYWFLDNWVPSADLRNIFDQRDFRDMITNLWSPFTKVPVEVMFNYNLFRKEKIKKFKGERKKLLGVRVDPRWIDHPVRTIRLFNEADRIIDSFLRAEGDTGRMLAVSRLFVGRAYPYNPAKQKDWWVYNTNKRIGELRRARNKAEKYYKDDQQVRVLDGLIEELEQERDYYKNLKVGN